MCGINFCLSHSGDSTFCFEKAACLDSITNKRGPDVSNTIVIQTSTSKEKEMDLRFHSSVLHLRGPLTQQPLIDEEENHLMWNGELFACLEIENENDSLLVLNSLKQCKEPQEILNAVSRFRGPFSFVYFQKNENRLWFARDVLGRRSLIWHIPKDENDGFHLSSVTTGGDCETKTEWEEVPARGIFMLDFNTSATDFIPIAEDDAIAQSVFSFKLHLYEWQKNPESEVGLTSPLHVNFNDQETTPEYYIDDDARMASDFDDILNNPDPFVDNAVDEFIELFSKSAFKRVVPVPDEAPRIGILFSGGIDSMMMAYFAGLHADPDQPIDLINVAFGNERVASNKQRMQQQQNTLSKKEKYKLARDRKYKKQFGVDPPQEKETQDEKNVSHEESQASSSESTNKDNFEMTESKPEVAVLPEVNIFDVPDRLTGRSGAEELSVLFPNRVWNFIEVDISFAEYEATKQHVTNLLHPLLTVMDLSIAIAMWFAARGTGTCHQYTLSNEKVLIESQPEYNSPAHILLVGIGADEQLGGYGRHRVKYKVKGWDGLAAEMKFDTGRIAHRNLGRDDRVISDHGREARFPFLDEELVNFLSSLPVYQKADMRYPRGLGEKYLLRRAARKLGLAGSAVLEKRAIQFGSRVAKIENRNEKGTDKL